MKSLARATTSQRNR